MKFRHHLVLAVVTSVAMCSVAATPSTKVRLEMWEGCLCIGPQHSRSYDQLNDERAKRVLFGKDATITDEDAKLAPLAFLRQHLGDSTLKDRMAFYRMGVVYRRSANGQSYTVHFRGSLRKLKMSDMKDGDLIVYYQEIY